MALIRVVPAVAAMTIAAQLVVGGVCAAAPDPDPDGVHGYADTLKALYNEAVAINDRIVVLQEKVDAYRKGGISEDALKRTLDPALAALRSDIEAYRGRIPPDLEPPTSNYPALDESSRKFTSAIKSLPDRLAAMPPALENLWAAAVAGDHAAYDRGTADILDHRADMYVVENAFLESILHQRNRDDPLHGFTRAEIGINDVAGNMFRITATAYRNGDFDAALYISRVGAALRQAEEGLADGEAATETFSRHSADGEITGKELRQRELIVAYLRAVAAETRKLIAANRRFLNSLRATFNDNSTLTKSVMLEAIGVLRADLERAAVETARKERIARELQELWRAD